MKHMITAILVGIFSASMLSAPQAEARAHKKSHHHRLAKKHKKKMKKSSVRHSKKRHKYSA